MPIPQLRRRSRAGRPVRILGLILAVTTVAVACGSPEELDAGAAPAGANGSDDRPGFLPDLTVTDVASGNDVVLTSLVPADRPVLLWFWAPH